MSLTSQLKDRASPIHQYMNESFPNVKPLRDDIRTALRGLEPIRPEGGTVKGGQFGTIATAFDYRARFYFDSGPPKRFVADQAVFWLDECDALPNLAAAYIESFRPGLEAFFMDTEPFGRRLSDELEDTLLRYCVVLALFEEPARAGLEACKNSPIMKLNRPDLDEFLGVAPAAWVDDLKRLSSLFYDKFADTLNSSAVLNPKFEGSKDVGGADGDIILNGCLIDIKTVTSLKAEKLTQWLYQQVGYWLLDYSDAYEIAELGFYFSRHGRRVTWPVKEMLETLSGHPVTELSEQRRQFKASIQ